MQRPRGANAVAATIAKQHTPHNMAAQHDMSADIKLAEQNASSIILGIEGAPHDPQKLTAMLREHGMAQTVISCELVHELAQPNSITGALDLALDDGSTKRLFVKKMTAAQVAHKAWNDRRRSLLYMRNEVRFYSEFPELAERGVRYPMVYGVEDQLEKVTGQLGGAVPEEPSDLSKCGALLWMEPVLGYDQGSPLPADKSAPGWKSNFYGAFVLNHRVVLHAIDATPARWRGDAGSSPLDRARTATSLPRNDLVKNCRVYPTCALVDFHTGRDQQVLKIFIAAVDQEFDNFLV